MSEKNNLYFPPEWAPQSGVMIAWPDKYTDWADTLHKVLPVYVEITKQIARFEDVLIVCRDAKEVQMRLPDKSLSKIHFLETDINDTWTRDFGPITVFEDGKPNIIDFGFNGWGNKYDWHHDNKVTQKLYNSELLAKVGYINRLNFILEGGSIETDGQGTLLTTSLCLLSGTRNRNITKADIEKALGDSLGIKQILWLTKGHLQGDDTDGHIDTLARFCNENTIAYVSCKNQHDDHFKELQAMEGELKGFKNTDGNSYHLVPLPMVPAIFDEENNRLPATYANFLIINRAVLVPVYGVDEDKEALEVLQSVFPAREIIPVNCLPLIGQHGSLHCITMQLPRGILKTE